jgi:hypothetical protein
VKAARGSRVLFVTLLAATVFIAGCSGDEETQNDSTDKQSTQEQTKNKDRTKEDTKMRKKDPKDKGSGGKVTLEIGGDPGTAFSGTCSAGDEESELSGEVPDSFSYDLGGRQLDCEIRKESAGSGALELLLTGPGGDRVQQRTDSPGGTISLSYSENGVSSSSTSSPGSSGSVNQVVSSSSSGTNSSSSSSTRSS